MPRKRSKKSGNSKTGELSAYHWRRRPSEIRGYNRALYLNADNGDYLRVDYNINDSRVRLFIEDSSENGASYYSVITNGKITAERDEQTGRSAGVSTKMASRSAYFESIPEQDVLDLINKVYGIRSDALKRAKSDRKKDARNKKEQKKIENLSDSFYRPEDLDRPRRKKVPFTFSRFIRERFIDFVDIAAGAGIAYALHIFFEKSLIVPALFAALYGILLGFIDIIWRERPPFFFKILLFIISGTALYVYAYYLI